MTAFSTIVPKPIRSPLPFPRLRPHRDHRRQRPDRTAVLPPGRRRRPAGDSRDARTGRFSSPIQSLRAASSTTGNGRALVTNVATFVVKLRPSDLPIEQRPVVVDGSRLCSASTAADINATIDGNPGSTFDLVRIAGDVDVNTARLISEAGFDLPGVEVAVEARRQYADGPLMSQILGYTGPVSGEQLKTLKDRRLPPRRPARQGRHRGAVRDGAARRPTGPRASSATARAAASRSSRPSRSPARATR